MFKSDDQFVWWTSYFINSQLWKDIPKYGIIMKQLDQVYKWYQIQIQLTWKQNIWKTCQERTQIETDLWE